MLAPDLGLVRAPGEVVLGMSSAMFRLRSLHGADSGEHGLD